MSQPPLEIRLTLFCEQLADTAPRLFRLSAWALLWLANLLLLLLLGAALLLPLLLFFRLAATHTDQALLWLALAVLTLPSCFALLAACRVRRESPPGIRLTRRRAPQLFAFLDAETRPAGVRLHEVRLLDEYGFYSSQRRLLGWHGRNRLHIGLPLCQSMDTDTFRALLAYQTAHLAHGHTARNDLIWRHQLRWRQIAERLQPHLAAPLLLPFVRYLLPLCDIWLHTLTRHQVLQCDQTASQRLSGSLYAAALCRLFAVTHYYDHRYWRDFWQQSRQSAEPPQPPYRHFPAALHTAETGEPQLLRTYLNWLLDTPAYSDDTHPTLSRRLEAIGEYPRLSAQQAPVLSRFGSEADAWIAQFDQDWWQHSRDNWRQQHHHAQQAAQRLAALDVAAAEAEPDLEAALERAWLTESVRNDHAAALNQLRDCYRRFPESPAVWFDYGRQLLHHNDADGVPLLHRAADAQVHLRLPAAEEEAEYHRRNGRHEAAAHYQDAAEQHRYEAEQADLERASWLPHHPLKSAELTPAELQAWLAQIDRIPGVGRLYLAQRQVQFLPQRPLYVIGYTLKLPFWTIRRNEAAERIRQRLLQLPFPHECFLIRLNSHTRAYARALKKIAHSRLR